MPSSLMDFSLDNVDWLAVANKQREVVKLIVVATPTPLDDVAEAQLGDLLIEWFVPVKHQTPAMFQADPNAAISPVVLTIIAQLVAAELPRLLEWLRNRKRA